MNLVNFLADVKCGGMTVDQIIPGTVSTVVTILKIAVPIILIVLGMIDLAKAVMANEEKEMKEAQKKLVKRIVYAVLIFFVVALVQFVFARLDEANGNKINATSCINCFINNNCEKP